MRWLLILLVLGVDLVALLLIIRTPVRLVGGSSFSPQTLTALTLSQMQLDDSAGSPRFNDTASGKRNRRTPFYALSRLRFLRNHHKRREDRKRHRHRQHKAEFVLRCPHLPVGEPQKNTRLGVEWSLNSMPWLRILSDGRRFESMHINKVDEWKGLDGRINLIAYGRSDDDESAQADANSLQRIKFEYEESRGWFAMRISKLLPSDGGTWQCLLKLRFPNESVLVYESRKTALIRSASISHRRRHGKNNLATTTAQTVPTSAPESLDAEEKGSYSDALFSFSKNDGESAVFSRVDRRRDLLAYTRESGESASFQKKTRSRSNMAAKSISSQAHVPLLLMLLAPLIS